MPDQVTLQVGTLHLAIQPDHLPPVGTRITVHKHLTEEGTTEVIEVTEQEWRLIEPIDEKELPTISIELKTRRVNS